jgi:hypothetical protein
MIRSFIAGQAALAPYGIIDYAKWRIWKEIVMPLPLRDAPLAAPHRPDAVAVKALVRVMDAWGVSNAQSANLVQESVRTWNRMRGGKWNGKLTKDQTVRISGIVGLYKALHLYFSDQLADRWPTLPNKGPLFKGRRPVDFMEEGGLIAILESRKYVDAIRGGI